MTITYREIVLDESDKTMIGKMMPLLNECQRRAFLSLYCEKLEYGSNLTGMSPTTLTARSVMSLNSRTTRTPAHRRAS